MTLFLKDRWAVVTGASAGIGKAIAEILAARGCFLFLVARREARLESLAQTLAKTYGVKVKWCALDLIARDAAATLFQQLEPYPISIVVNNAGFAVAGRLEKADGEELSRMIDLNIGFLTEFCRLMVPRLKDRSEGGHILNVGSVAGYQGVPFMASYAATKAYVNHFTEGLNWELRGTGVGVTCLQPGQTASEFFQVAGLSDSKMANAGLLSCEQVAREGVNAMVKGKPKTVAGLLNKVRVFGLRLTPRSLVRLVITGMFRDMA